MKLDVLLDRLEGTKSSGKGYIALCPAHDDHHPSLSINENNGKILLHCFAGCRTEAILEKIGLTFLDLFKRR